MRKRQSGWAPNIYRLWVPLSACGILSVASRHASSQDYLTMGLSFLNSSLNRLIPTIAGTQSREASSPHFPISAIQFTSYLTKCIAFSGILSYLRRTSLGSRHWTIQRRLRYLMPQSRFDLTVRNIEKLHTGTSPEVFTSEFPRWQISLILRKRAYASIISQPQRLQ